MEITAEADREYAKAEHLEICWTKLGNRCFEAVLVPCSHELYLEYIKEEMAYQDAQKQDGRCNISNGRGGIKRCPCRIPNPKYGEGSGLPKTLPVSCDGCMYESFRHEHSVVPFSTLESDGEDRDVVIFDLKSPENYYAGEKYERLREQWIEFVEKQNHKLTDLADLLSMGYLQSEAAQILGKPTSTICSQKEKLKRLVLDFLDYTILE